MNNSNEPKQLCSIVTPKRRICVNCLQYTLDRCDKGKEVCNQPDSAFIAGIFMLVLFIILVGSIAYEIIKKL